jgi:hypothetical protein
MLICIMYCIIVLCIERLLRYVYYVYVCTYVLGIGRIVGTNTIAIAIIFLFPISAVACYCPILLLSSSS